MSKQHESIKINLSQRIKRKLKVHHDIIQQCVCM